MNFDLIFLLFVFLRFICLLREHKIKMACAVGKSKDDAIQDAKKLIYK